MRNFELKPTNKDTVKSFYGKATVEENDNIITLYSYCTKVAEIQRINGEPQIKMLVKASPTTTRHITSFLRQNGFADILQNVSGFRNIVKVLQANHQNFEIKEF